MHKKLISLCLICSVLGSSTTAFATTNINPQLNNSYSIEDTTSTKTVSTEFTTDDLAKIEKCISRQSDGTLKLDMNAALELGYKSDDLTQLETYFSSLNEKILSGLLKTDENLNITNTKNVQKVLKSGAIAMASSDGFDYSQTHWWGIERFANNKNSIDLAAKFTSFSWGSGGTGAASEFLSKVFGVGNLFTKEIGYAVTVLGTPYFGYMGHRISTMNKGSGVRICLTWVGTFSVETQ